MTQAEQLAAFVARASYGGLSEAARAQLKIRVLDALGCAIGALEGEPVRMLRAQTPRVRRRRPVQPDRRRAHRAGPRRALQQRARPIPRLQ